MQDSGAYTCLLIFLLPVACNTPYCPFYRYFNVQYCLIVSVFAQSQQVIPVIVVSTASLRCCQLRRPKQQLWRPDSQRSLLVPDKADASGQIWCGQGPPPPNPMVVERFSQVISQLFQQVGNNSFTRLANVDLVVFSHTAIQHATF